jgi:hypothetical protein
VCDALYSGSNCSMVCPLAADGSVCGNSGKCVDGACLCVSGTCGTNCSVTGSACTSCSTGMWGTSCEFECTGGAATACTTHGTCSDGRNGDGTCSCTAGYAGLDCSLICPGGLATPCNGFGSCQHATGLCVCDPFYGTAGCGVVCPGLSGSVVCSSHGTCDSGAVGSAQCTCSYGYTGVDCGSICPGGATAPCSNHGTCNANTTCTCTHSASAGHWAGSGCDVCADGWVGTACTLQCGYANGLQCGGHGLCNAEALCECHATDAEGYWTGALCTGCVAGYFGSNCSGQCEGGACQICGGRGTCNSGPTGDGQCACFSVNGSYFGGSACETCIATYWGAECNLRCPGNVSDCGGQGACSEGFTGNGTCSCNDGYAVNAADDGMCTACDVNYFGATCQPCGRTTAIDVSCSGNGTCDDGKIGSGTCGCNADAAGEYCQYSCPSDSGGKACGFGYCTISGCACYNSFTIDAAGICTECKTGYYGGNCTVACPLDCGSHGACRQGTSGDGTCACSTDYGGSQCEIECPGGASNACNGHGTCVELTGACSCYTTAALGHYNGTKCDRCAAGYNSAFCNVSCPVNGGQVCNGRGTCSEGVCSDCQPLTTDTASMYCGTACHQSGITCLTFATTCPAGFWGFGCVKLCPGADATGANACSDQGTCNTDSGECICNSGYAGVDCSSKCGTVTIGNHQYMCAGHGACQSGTCACTRGYWGDLCAHECPGSAANPCSDVGTCNATTGICHCDSGLAGSECTISCLGGQHNPCSMHGQCQAADGACVCDTGAAFFDGASCQRCKNGYGGGDCATRCATSIQGSGYDCVCLDNYGGVDCTIPCPGLNTDTGVCSSHGICATGSSNNATCTCDTDYYGTGCAVQCTAAMCLASDGLVNAQCGTANGTCECLNNGVQYWAGSTCDICVDQYWGLQCNLRCPCNDHGACDKDTGTCFCFQSDAEGYWAGTYCDVCANGYIGLKCKGKHVEVSTNTARTAAYSVAVSDTTMPSVMLVDAANNGMYVGNDPLVVLEFGASGQPTAVATVAALPVIISKLQILNSTHVLASGFTGAGIVQQFAIQRWSRTSYPAFTTLTHGGFDGAAAASGRRAAALATALEATATVDMSNRSTVTVASMSSGGATTTRTFTLAAFSAIENADIADGLFIAAGAHVTSGSWLVAVVRLGDITGGATIAPQLYHSTTVDASAECTQSDATLTCDQALRCVPRVVIPVTTAGAAATGDMLCVIARTSAMLMLRFPFVLDGTAPNIQAANVDLVGMTARKTSPYNVTVMAVDNVTSTGLAYVAMNTLFEGSTLYKFRVDGTAMTGIYGMAAVGLDYPLIQALYVDGAARELWMVVQLAYKISVQSINMFGVQSVSPDVIDSAGSTVVTVKGEGFSSFATPSCLFGGDAESVVTGTYQDETTLLCAAPPSSSAAAGGTCTALLFNVAFARRLTTATNVPFQRPNAVVVVAAGVATHGNAYHKSGDADIVTITGVGFVASSRAACSLSQSGGKTEVLSLATFINTTAISCNVKATVDPTMPPAFLTYSHDGWYYGQSTVPFAVLGVPTGINAFTTNGETTFVSSATAFLPEVTIHVVDINRNSVHIIDTAQRASTAGMTTAGSWSPNATSEATVLNGVAVFDKLAVSVPKTGTLKFFFTAANGAIVWRSEITLTVLVGKASGLAVTTANASALWRYGSSAAQLLDPSPVIIVVDDAGNTIEDEAQLPVAVKVAWTDYTEGSAPGSTASAPNEQTAGQTAKTYTFASIAARGLHGSLYGILFSALGAPHIGDLVVDNIAVEKCGAAEYGVGGTSRCAACPTHGICDGTTVVKVVDGYWRSTSTSYVFYDCAPPNSAASCVNGGGCQDGYTGAVCSVCADGYGKTGVNCNKCSSQAVNYTILGLVTLAILGIVYFLVTNSIAAGDKPDGVAKDVLPIIIKMLVNHVQLAAITGLTNTKTPAVLGDFFRGQQTASSINPNFQFAACEVTQNNYKAFVLVAVSPAVLIVAIALMQALRLIARRDEDLDTVMLAKLQKGERNANRRELLGESVTFEDAFDSLARSVNRSHTVPSRTKSPQQLGILGIKDSVMFAESLNASQSKKPELSRPKQWLNFVAVTFLVVLFLVYPTILELSGNMLDCETIDYGDSPSRRVLTTDRSIDCDSEQYTTYQVLAYIHLVGYGVGLPALSAAMVKLISVTTMDGMPAAKKLFFFMTGGFSDNRWWWESIILMRKAAVVLIAFSIGDNTLRVYASMWVMLVSFVTNAVFLPYSDAMLSAVEMASLLCLGVSLNLSLLFDHFTEEQSPGLFYAVVAGIFAINGAVLCAFAGAIVIASRRRVKSLVESDPLKWAALRPLVEQSLSSLERGTDALLAEHHNCVEALKEQHPRLVALAELVAELEADAYIDPAAEVAIAGYNTYLATAVLRLNIGRGCVADDFEEMMRVERAVLDAWYVMACAELQFHNAPVAHHAW